MGFPSSTGKHWAALVGSLGLGSGVKPTQGCARRPRGFLGFHSIYLGGGSPSPQGRGLQGDPEAMGLGQDQSLSTQG